MKKILLLAIVALVASANSYAEMNSSTTKGERRVLTDSKKLAKIENGKLTLALGIKIDKNDTLMAFVAYCDANLGHAAFIKGDRIMIRLTDNSVIELVNRIEKYDDSMKTTVSQNYETNYGFVYGYGRFGRRYMPYEYTSLVPEVNVEKVEISYGLYPVTRDQMRSIIGKGIVKFRIQVEDRDVDLEGNKASKLTRQITGMRDQLIEILTTTPDRSQF